MKRILSLLAVMIFTISLGACGTGPLDRGESESNVSSNTEDGDANVDVNSAFTVTLGTQVNSSSVTTSTFFVAGDRRTHLRSRKCHSGNHHGLDRRCLHDHFHADS